MKPTLDTVRRELNAMADPAKAAILSRFFKTGPGEYGEGDVFLGVVVPKIRKLVRKYGDLEAGKAVRLLKSPVHEERLFALLLLVHRFERAGEDEKEKLFRHYMGNLRFVNNWDLVDLSAPRLP